MTERSRPSEDVLFDYARGSLSPGIALTVSAHLEQCRECRRRSSFLDSIGGVVVAGLQPETLSADALDRALSRLAAGTPAPRAQGPYAAIAGRSLSPWIWVAPGVWGASVNGAGEEGEGVFIVRAKAGSRFPLHGHGGRECVAVLQGAFSDDDRTYREGDFVECSHEVIHELTVPAGSDCVCLLAAQGGLRFTGVRQFIAKLIGV